MMERLELVGVVAEAADRRELPVVFLLQQKINIRDRNPYSVLWILKKTDIRNLSLAW